MKQILRALTLGRRSTRSLAAALLVGAGLLGLAPKAQAQVDSYTLSASQGTFTQLNGGTVVADLEDDDALSQPIPLGFTFTFDGRPYTQVVASSNGWLSFNTAAADPAYSNSLRRADATARPLVAPLWDDLDGTDGTSSYSTTGTAPNRVFTFEWREFYWTWSAADVGISFQVKLYEGTNRVEFVYRRESGALDVPSASIGLAGTGTGFGSFLSLSDASAAPTTSFSVENASIATKPATGQVYAFTPPAASACGTVSGVSFTGVTTSTAQLNFTPVTGATSYTVTYGLPGGTTTTVTPAPTASPVALSGLSGSSVYWVTIVANCAGSQTSLPVRASFATPLTNDDPAGALTLPITATCTTGTYTSNVGATTTTPSGYTNPGCAAAANPKDVWFKFTTPATGAASTAVRVSVSGSAAGQIRAFSAASAAGPFTDIGCASSGDNDTESEPLDLVGLTPNTTYYLRVAGFGSADVQDEFSICVSNPPACGDPINASLSALTNTSITLTFTPGNANTSYTVTYTPVGGPATTITPAPTASPVVLTGLTPGTTYLLTIQANCAGGLQGNVLSGTFTTTAPVPANDNPCGAVALVPSQGCVVTTGSNVSATTTTPNGYANPGSCGIAVNPKDVWFSFIATGTSMSIRTVGDAAGLVRVFSAATCSSAFTQLACSAGATNNVGAGSFNVSGLTIGSTYYVSVAGYGSGDDTGSFTICASNGILSAQSALAAGSLDVFPNPTSTGQLTVKLTGVASAATAEARLFNSLGQVVQAKTLTLRGGAAEQQLSTAGLRGGLYTLHLRVGNETVTRKVVVE